MQLTPERKRRRGGNRPGRSRTRGALAAAFDEEEEEKRPRLGMLDGTDLSPGDAGDGNGGRGSGRQLRQCNDSAAEVDDACDGGRRTHATQTNSAQGECTHCSRNLKF